MAKKAYSPGVLFFKRLIAATLALIILTLAGLSIYFGVKLGQTRGMLAQTQDALVEYQLKEAEEEAERLRSLPPPEQAKPAGEASAADIFTANTLVAHALGSVDGEAGLNCLEGFTASYEAGIRVFEADLRMTSDGALVLRHDWIGGLQEGVDPTRIPTLEEFKAKKLKGKYTPLSFRDLLLLMVRYPDICVITDTKFTDTEAVDRQFRAIVDEAHALGLSYLFDRFIVQIYSPEHFEVVDGIHHFPCYIYTLYQDYFGKTEDSFRSKAIFCQEHGILGVTMDATVWDPDYAPIANWRGVHVSVHTVNDADTAKKLLRTGVKTIYTDTLTPADLAPADTNTEGRHNG